jgi:hypothetical protein
VFRMAELPETTNVAISNYPLTKEECLKIGGHCYVEEPFILLSNPPRSIRICKHCGNRQISVPPRTEEESWRDYP